MAGRFMFWGLFLALAAILAGYALWLAAVERREARGRSDDPPPGSGADRMGGASGPDVGT